MADKVFRHGEQGVDAVRVVYFETQSTLPQELPSVLIVSFISSTTAHRVSVYILAPSARQPRAPWLLSVVWEMQQNKLRARLRSCHLPRTLKQFCPSRKKGEHKFNQSVKFNAFMTWQETPSCHQTNPRKPQQMILPPPWRSSRQVNRGDFLYTFPFRSFISFYEYSSFLFIHHLTSKTAWKYPQFTPCNADAPCKHWAHHCSHSIFCKQAAMHRKMSTARIENYPTPELVIRSRLVVDRFWTNFVDSSWKIIGPSTKTDETGSTTARQVILWDIQQQTLSVCSECKAWWTFILGNSHCRVNVTFTAIFWNGCSVTSRTPSCWVWASTQCQKASHTTGWGWALWHHARPACKVCSLCWGTTWSCFAPWFCLGKSGLLPRTSPVEEHEEKTLLVQQCKLLPQQLWTMTLWKSDSSDGDGECTCTLINLWWSSATGRFYLRRRVTAAMLPSWAATPCRCKARTRRPAASQRAGTTCARSPVSRSWWQHGRRWRPRADHRAGSSAPSLSTTRCTVCIPSRSWGHKTNTSTCVHRPSTQAWSWLIASGIWILSQPYPYLTFRTSWPDVALIVAVLSDGGVAARVGDGVLHDGDAAHVRAQVRSLVQAPDALLIRLHGHHLESKALGWAESNLFWCHWSLGSLTHLVAHGGGQQREDANVGANVDDSQGTVPAQNVLEIVEHVWLPHAGVQQVVRHVHVAPTLEQAHLCRHGNKCLP